MACIYDMYGDIIADGLTGCARSNEALRVARRLVAERGTPVLVYDEDDGDDEYDHYGVVEVDGWFRPLDDDEAVHLGLEIPSALRSPYENA